MYENMPDRKICCIDMRSFYASAASQDLGLDVTKTPIAVIGNMERNGSVVLASSPLMKSKFGIKTGNRKFEIPNDPSIVLVEPKMEFYVKISMEIARLLGEYAPKEDIHVYSIDEIFLNCGNVSNNSISVKEIVLRIQDDLIRAFGLPSAAGVGPNMLMSKLALDLQGKKTGYAEWTYDDIPSKLWTVSPLSEMWGIGSRTEKTLHGMGIYTVGDLANTPLHIIEDKFGSAMGNQLWNHSWGRDISELGAPLLEGQVSYGKGQMLLKDYTTIEAIHTVILEMCEDIAMRAREAGRAGRTISLGIGYSKNAFGGGFSRSTTIEEATNDTMQIYRVCKRLLAENYSERPVRHVSISLTKLEDETSIQLSLFNNRVKERQLGTAMDSIRKKYGSTALLRAVSFTEAGTALQRANLIGGHKK
ncbi:MAG: UV damage repair protein UvrX [Paenisporosarcina sp.]|nr:UV damage repair protein UvrX [Paenisporosarcina sp.]